MDLSKDFFLSCNAVFLFFDKAILNAFDLSSYRIKVIIVIFDSVLSFFMNHLFKVVPIYGVIN